MRVGESWAHTRRNLDNVGIADADIEAEALLRYALDMDRAEFFTALNETVSPAAEISLDLSLIRRLGGEPLAYITGRREFYGLDLLVNHHVLIPRQETELLVDKAREFAGERHEDTLTVADVGTGSGAVGIAIAHHIDNADVLSIDLSRQALLVADANRRRHGLQRRVRLIQGDLLGPLRSPVDLIVSNPPYLREDEMVGLAPEVKREPEAALDGGHDGLYVVRRLLKHAAHLIRPGGLVLLEIAPAQLNAVLEMGRILFPLAELSFSRDALGLPRAVTIALQGDPRGGQIPLP